MKIYAFSDEAASGLSEQIAAMKRNGLDGTEIRGVNGRNITALTVQEAAETLRQLKDNGLCVWSVGSPIGKIPLDGDYAGHLELLRHTLELANTLECANLRMFSFYLPEGAKPESCRTEVIEKLAQMAEIAADFGVFAMRMRRESMATLRSGAPVCWMLYLPCAAFSIRPTSSSAARMFPKHGSCWAPGPGTCISRTPWRTERWCRPDRESGTCRKFWRITLPGAAKR